MNLPEIKHTFSQVYNTVGEDRFVEALNKLTQAYWEDRQDNDKSDRLTNEQHAKLRKELLDNEDTRN